MAVVNRLPPKDLLNKIKKLYFSEKSVDGTIVPMYSVPEISELVGFPVEIINSLIERFAWNKEREALIIRKKTSELSIADEFEKQEALSDAQILDASKHLVTKILDIVSSSNNENENNLTIQDMQRATETLFKLDELQQRIQQRIKEQKIKSALAENEKVDGDDLSKVMSSLIKRFNN